MNRRNLARIIPLAAAAWLAAGATSQPAPAPQPEVRGFDVADHAYRIVGRARLIFFTLSADDVGGARLTWKRTAEGESARLLAGSEPARAPRELNEWGYTSEEEFGDRANTFAVRSMNASDFMGEPPRQAPPPRAAAARQFRAVCSSSAGAAVQTLTTTVTTEREITYRALGNLLDRLAGTPRWQPRGFSQPVGAAPGFLIAFGRLLRASVDAQLAQTSQPTAVPYIYNAMVYDLKLRKVRPLRNVSVGARTYARVLRGDFVTVRRSDGDETPFTVTYPVDGTCASVPIAIAFRASWWLTIELQLDDEYEVPADPGRDASMASRIREICAAASAIASQ